MAIPREWESNLMIPIYKREQTQCENYRLYYMFSTKKLQIMHMNTRKRKYAEENVEDEQATFRPERQTNEVGREVFLVFIDLKAAFD